MPPINQHTVRRLAMFHGECLASTARWNLLIAPNTETPDIPHGRMSTPHTPTFNVKSAARFADILEFVADSASPPTFADIATGLGVPKSSLFNLLGTLTERGYLQQNGARGGYQLGPMISKLAGKQSRPASHALVVQPILKELAMQLNETCGYYELLGDEAEVMRTESSSQALAYILREGDRAPLYCVSAGKALMAQWSTEELKAYLQRTTLRRYTETTLTTSAALTREMKKIREAGLAYSMQEYSTGIVGMAIVVHAGKQVIGALNVAMPAARYNSEMDLRVRHALAQAAAAVERKL
ncbi:MULTISPECIES: IclR family transcriptional regulator [unclassified Burkholderia]|uniref:IclR family transcriptional regulator n=1 Tax=unclassified Burkholderia TaxID=2613784 RepID=UPI002AB0953E|nr:MULTISPECIES: IclR family transcriptional regulator [unclassified Burkholderia]